MAVITNTTITTDVAPEISFDISAQLSEGYRKLAEILGVSRMDAVPEGSAIKVYKSAVKGNIGAQVGEGDVINLTEVERVATPYTMGLKKYRKLVTAEAIQKSGREVAIYDTDRALISAIRKEVKADFFNFIATGTGTATAGTNLQTQLANNWAGLQTYFEDEDVEPVHFVNPADVATYLGTAQITMQSDFGFSYVENFLGLGTVIIANGVTAGNVYSTAKENLHCAYVPANGSVGQEFELTADESGLVGVTHDRVNDRASIGSLMMTGVKFFAEDLAGVIKGSF